MSGGRKCVAGLHHSSISPRIVEHFEEIRDLFGKSPEVMTDPELIRTYVAQNNGKSSDDPELERYYSYLAVQRADIYCRFYEDCGDIVLVDTVGLEDTQFGIEEAMLNTVDQECDAAIVVTKPIGRLCIRPMNRSTTCCVIISRIVAWINGFFMPSTGIRDKMITWSMLSSMMWKMAILPCVTAMIVDCSDPVDVRDHFVMPMLQKLVANMDTIDQAYLNEINELEKAFLRNTKPSLPSCPKPRP